jgi:hypothetical protein
VEWIIVILLIVGVLVLLAKIKRAGPPDFPYEQQRTLMSPAERSFYGVLCKAVEGNAVVFAKVRVGDVIKTKSGLTASERQSAFNRISAKHFDFVLCRPSDLSIFATIELDDKSHGSAKRVDRDKFLEGACQSANLRLHRFKASKSYVVADIQQTLFGLSKREPNTAFGNQKVEPVILDQDFESDSKNDSYRKLCPKCGSALVQRVAKKGKHKGSQFLACSAFPRCRYIDE